MIIRRILQKALAAGLVLIFISYMGYQLYSGLSDPITTIDAAIVTVEERLAVEGVFFRSQSLVMGGMDKSMEYLVTEGEKVARSQNVAVYFDSGTAKGTYQQLQELEDHIASLEYALRTLSGGADSAKVDSLIYVEMQQIIGQLEQGAANKVGSNYSSLRQLIISRGATKNDRESYEAQLAALRTEKNGLESTLGSSVSRISTAESGYFFPMTDGYETLLTPKTITDMTPAQLESLRPDIYSGDVVGTVVNAYEWYYAAVVTPEEAAHLRNYTSLEMFFPQIGGQGLTMKVYSISAFEDGRGIAVFQSKIMKEAYLSARFQSADIILNRYTGIKVPTEALRQVDNVWGVYCMDGAKQVFKAVKWIYQTEGYVLVSPSKNSKEGLVLYDKIIIRTKGLEVGS